MTQPRIRHNDHSVLDPPELGDWRPRMSVSIVVPAFGDQDKLDIVLAALAAQSYPAHLIEVVVVDDGSVPPLRLPEIAPENTRLMVGGQDGWGPSHTTHVGALAAEGEIVLRMDSDMLPFREHVEAQARWHHLADYLVVFGHKRLVEVGEGAPTPEAVYQAVLSGAADRLFDVDQSLTHWSDKVYNRRDNLRTSYVRAFAPTVGMTMSLTRDLYFRSGGGDTELVLGGDTEHGYRLAQTGAAFIPDAESRSWHLGITQMVARPEDGKRARRPYVAHRIPVYREWRRGHARRWLVPYVDVVVETGDIGDASYEEIRATVLTALNGGLSDVRITLVGPWSTLTAERYRWLDDPSLDLRLLREDFRHDDRVRFLEAIEETSAPAQFRFVCPRGWQLRPGALMRLVKCADDGEHGLVSLALPAAPGVAAARLERTAAVARALHVRRPDEQLDDAIDAVSGVYWLDGTEWGMVHLTEEDQTDATQDSPALRAARERAREARAETALWRHKAGEQREQAEMWKRVAERWRAEALTAQHGRSSPARKVVLRARRWFSRRPGRAG